jgi:hypothetical protein
VIVKVYKDHGISGAKGRDKRPAFDALRRDATQRKFDVVMAWSVDRLGRSLQDMIGFLSELHVLRLLEHRGRVASGVKTPAHCPTSSMAIPPSMVRAAGWGSRRRVGGA